MIRIHLLQSSILILQIICIIYTCYANGEDEASKGTYMIGTGIHDITGPAAQINFMGYARSEQTGTGIHMRLRARSFIISDYIENDVGKVDAMNRFRKKDETFWTDTKYIRRRFTQTGGYEETYSRGKTARTICFVSIDAGMGSDLLTKKVLERFHELIQDSETVCHLENTSISGTHTHSAPAGFLQYTLYQISSLGFVHEAFDAYVEGIAQSLYRAFLNMEKASIDVGQGLLFGANINRSPTSYILNPKEERDLYAKEGDTDKNMVLLKFNSIANNKLLGVLNWFSVHGTSMNATNTLISGDNKGYASYLMEKSLNPEGTLPGKGDFVAAFASTNLGDVSPNTNGPKCMDTGLPCDAVSSTCNGRNELCIATGPGKDMFESTEIIGRKQFDHAMNLMRNTSTHIQGTIDFRHSFVNMSNVTVNLKNGTHASTCDAALGYSFAAGTTDGPGAFDFSQSQNSSNVFWNIVSGFLSEPSEDQIKCHAPKPILLNIGNLQRPYRWDPESVPISIFKVGQLFILNVPSEFTTMAGRRLKRSILSITENYGVQNAIVVIAGLSNSYTHYVTTEEEYQGQRYEAASTLYGPHTLAAYIQEFERLCIDLFENKRSRSEPAPADIEAQQMSLLPPVIVDNIAFGKKFGSIVEDANDQYHKGDKVIVKFRSSNPRNNLRLESTFLTVDIMVNGLWETRFVDGDWCTKFEWEGNVYLGYSYAIISWIIPHDVSTGIYRICHYGTRKKMITDDSELSDGSTLEWGSLVDYEGCSRAFSVNPKDSSYAL